MNYDPKYLFILTVTITVDAKESFATEEALVKILLQVIHSFVHSLGEIERHLQAARLGLHVGRQQKNTSIFSFFRAKTEEQ